MPLPAPEEDTRAPAVRKHWSADALFSRLRTGFSDIPDHRPGTPKIPLADALMSAFAMFSLKSLSLLSKHIPKSNVLK